MLLLADPYIKLMVLNLKRDIEGLRAAGKATAQVLEFIASHIRPGVSTAQLNDLCHDFITNKLNAIPASLGYQGFSKSICTSINNVVCHGIPAENKLLRSGDIINVDVAVILDGYYGDSSCTFLVGKVNSFARRLVAVCRQCLYHGIREALPGKRLGDIGAAIQAQAEEEGFSVVKEYCGHGTGKKYHTSPSVLHYGVKGTGPVIRPGMCFTIEPMINAGRAKTRVLEDGWTVVTQDGSLSAQWEHTILVQEDGCEVLTQRTSEQIS